MKSRIVLFTLLLISFAINLFLLLPTTVREEQPDFDFAERTVLQIVSQSLQYDVNQIADTCRLLKAGEMSAEQLSNWAEHMYGLGSYCWHQFRMYEHNTNQSYFSTEFMDAMDEYLLVRGQWLSAHTNVEDHAIEVPLNLYEDLEYALNRIPNSIIDMDAELEGYCVQQLQEATRSMEAYVSMVEEST